MFHIHNELALTYASRETQADAPLIHLVHGRAGTVDVMSIFRKSIPEHWNIVQVQAPHQDPIGGYSWWHITDGSFDPDRALEACKLYKTFRREYLSKHALAPRFEVAIGFSQGSGLLSVLLQREPKLFRGIGILAGFVIPLENVNAEYEEAPPSIFWAHGTKDPVIKLSRAQKGVDYLHSLGLSVSFVTDEVEHKIGRSGMRELKNWLHHFSL